MGYYIEAPTDIDKAKYFFDHYDAELVLDPENFDFSSDFALICVIDNGVFEAAGIAFDAVERDEFLPHQRDQRPRVWLKIKKTVVRKLNPNVPI